MARRIHTLAAIRLGLLVAVAFLAVLVAMACPILARQVVPSVDHILAFAFHLAVHQPEVGLQLLLRLAVRFSGDHD